MYDPWHKSDPSTAAIIKLIEEKERNEAKYGEEAKNWDIMRLKDASASETSRYVEHDSSTRPWMGSQQRSGGSVSEAGHWRRGVVPAGHWGKAIASFDKQLKAEIKTVEWKLKRRSSSSEERDSMHSKRRQKSPENSKKRERSRSVSGDRRRKRRQSRSRSGSRPKRRVQSRSRERKRDRSGSRETRRRKSVSRDRKHKKSNRGRSSSNDSGTRDSSPRKHTKNAQPTPDNSATAEILSRFLSIVNNAKEKPASNDTKKVPDPNVLPEFDPNNKGHAMLTWLIRVDDVAKLFGWNEKETLQYSLPKLVGDAKTWYQTLTTVPYSWAEWKKTLLEQFPCPNFAELLTEISIRHALPTETLEQYFYAKVVLLNRCGFKGRQAVDCLVQGIETAAIRLCAHAAQFAEPEDLLVYLKSAESLRQIPKTITEHLPPLETTSTVTTITKTTKKTQIPKEAKKMKICYECGMEGHRIHNCWIKKKRQLKSTNIRKPSKKMNPGQPLYLSNLVRGPRSNGPCRLKAVRPPDPEENQIVGPLPNKPEDNYAKPNFEIKCHKCQKSGHIRSKCPENKKRYETAVAGASQQGTDSQPPPPGLED